MSSKRSKVDTVKCSTVETPMVAITDVPNSASTLSIKHSAAATQSLIGAWRLFRHKAIVDADADAGEAGGAAELQKFMCAAQVLSTSQIYSYLRIIYIMSNAIA